MSQASSIPVLFHGDHLYLVSHNSEPFTPIKPIVQNMGLDWSAQHTKLRANKERWGMVIITIPLSGAGVQQMTCMPVRKLPAFMSSINPNKVKSELREKVILYQNECDDVLWKYWCDKVIKPEQEQPTLPSTITPDQQCTLHNMVKALVEKGGIYANIWSRFNNHFRLGSYKQLPQSRMGEAVNYLMNLEVQPKALPEAKPKLTIWHCLPDADRSCIHQRITQMRRSWTKDIEDYILALRYAAKATGQTPPHDHAIATARVMLAQLHYILDGMEHVGFGIMHLERHLAHCS